MPTEYQFLDLIDRGVFVIEPDDVGRPSYAWINAAARREIPHHDPRELGQTAMDLMPGQPGRTAYCKQLRALWYRSKSEFLLRLSGRPDSQALHCTLTPDCDTTGKPKRLIGTVDVVSDREGTERTAGAIDALGGDIAGFVHLAAHDLRAPLNQVRAICDLMRDTIGTDDREARDLLEILEKVGNSAMELIADVLDHARTTATPSDHTCFRLGGLVTDIMTMLDPMNRAVVDVEDVQLDCDRSVVLAALRNLIDNALKHSSSQAPEIRVSAVAWPGDVVTVSLRDNGHGFDEPTTVFEARPGFSAGGFGLLGVKHLISARGGTIAARNDFKTGGAIVTFTLPGTIVPPEVSQLAS